MLFLQTGMRYAHLESFKMKPIIVLRKKLGMAQHRL